MAAAVLATGVTATFTGSRRIWLASAAMGPGMVAENRRFWRTAGSSATIRRIGWMKPMSSIRSASSRTRI